MIKKRIVFVFLFFSMLSGTSFAFTDDKLSSLYGSYLKGLAYFGNGKYAQSLKEFEKARSIDSASAHIRIKLAFVLMRLGKLDKAEKEFKEVKSLDPDKLEASLGLIFIYSYLGEKDKLESEYGYFLQRAHKLRPEDTRISEYLAQFYFYRKRLDDAIRIYKTIVKDHPDYIEAKYLLGYFYEEKGMRKEAIKIWKEVLDKNPSHVETLNALGYLYAEEGSNLDEAENMVKKALKQDPENSAYLDSLGWVYFKKNDYKNAKRYLEKAIAGAKDPVIYEHLGDVCIKLNNVEEAVKYYNEGLKLDPKNKDLKEKVDKYGKQDKTSGEKSKSNKKVDN